MLPHVSLAEFQMLRAAAVCALTHGLRGKSGKLLISVIIDTRPHSHTHATLSLSHIHTHTCNSLFFFQDVNLNISKASVCFNLPELSKH